MSRLHVTELGIYLPNPTLGPEGEFLAARIIDGSGIVGSNAEAWLAARHGEVILAASSTALTIDYEGNRYGASNIKTWADRLVHAAGRHVECYPTVARAVCQPEAVIHVGTMQAYPQRDSTVPLIEFDSQDTLDAVKTWLGVDNITPELKTTRGGW